jgi:uncharacterized membrane protein
MPNLELHGLEKRLEERIMEVQKILDRADKISRRSIRVAYIGVGISILAVILAIVPLID